MSMDSVIDLDKVCGRKLSEAEAARLREIGNRLNLREDDALWPLLAALEYQRVYYEALPKKIAAASKTIMDGMAVAAEKETAAAQARLTDSVVKEARYLASKIQWGELLPMIIAGVIAMFTYSALCMWAGFQLGAGEIRPVRDVLLIPWAPLAFLGIGLCGVLYLLPSLKKLCDQEEYAGWHCLGATVIIIGSVLILNLLNVRFTERILG